MMREYLLCLCSRCLCNDETMIQDRKFRICISQQDNKISFWSIGNHETSANDDGFEGDPQLLCEQRHKGDVLELQVSLAQPCFHGP